MTIRHVVMVTFSFWVMFGTIWTCDPVQAQNSVKIALMLPPAKPTFKEPIFLNLVIQNSLPEKIRFNLGHNRKSNLEFTITQPGGTTVRTPRVSEEGFGLAGNLALEAGQSYTQRVLLDEWYQVSRPGVYAIKIVLISSVITESGLSVSTEGSGTVNLEVLPPNPDMLSMVCQKLAATATGSSIVAEAADASLALSYVRDPIAVPYLREILESGSILPKMYAASGLGKIGNKDAIQALILTLNVPDKDLSSFVRTVLDAMRTSVKDPELRIQIENALRNPR